jgi:hypothetical protein
VYQTHDGAKTWESISQLATDDAFEAKLYPADKAGSHLLLILPASNPYNTILEVEMAD